MLSGLCGKRFVKSFGKLVSAGGSSCTAQISAQCVGSLCCVSTLKKPSDGFQVAVAAADELKIMDLAVNELKRNVL